MFDPEKIYVLGAYWQKDEDAFTDFQASMVSQIKKQNGKIIFYKTEIETLFGYTEPASMMTIIEWESQAAFDEYYAQMTDLLDKAIKASSEFYLSIPTPS